MIRRTYIAMFGVIWLNLSLWAQEVELRFNGNFNDVPFLDFVKDIQAQTGASFYFLSEWIEDIKVTALGEGLLLTSILDSTIVPEGLHYMVIDQYQFFISKEAPFNSNIPDYSGYLADLSESSVALHSGSLTSTEQKYIFGRKSGVLDTLIVGSAMEDEEQISAVIFGKISDRDTGEPLIGATIYFEELKRGAATDLDGRFNIVVKPGKYTVEFKCMGMEEKKSYMEVLSSGSVNVNLAVSITSITEVVISSGRYHNVRGTQMGIDRLNYKVLNEVPVVMGEKDVIRVIQMLPGVQSVGEGAAGFNVRGSAHDQNMIYLNKIPVYNSAHLFGFFTLFNPDIIRDFTLYKSNMPASYGGRLASFFDITTRQGNMNKFAARGGISPVTGHLTVESPIIKGKSALMLAGRATYSDWILKQVEIPVIKDSQAEFYDLAGAWTWEPGAKTLIKFFGYKSQDQFTLGNTNDYAYSNLGGSFNLRQQFGSRVNANLAIVFGEYEFSAVDRQIETSAFTQDYRISHHEGKLDMSVLSLGKQNFTFGVNAIYYDLDRGTIEPYGQQSLRNSVDFGEEFGMEAAAYLADEIFLFPWLTVYAGLRYVSYKTLGPDEVLIYAENKPALPWNVTDTLSYAENEVSSSYTSLEPRAALNIMMGPNNSLKFSYNRVRQFLFMLTNTIAISPTDQWKLCDYHIKPPLAEQYSMGYYLNIPKGNLTTSLEFYYKTLIDVVEYKDGASFISTPHTETLTLTGNQEAYGVEAMIRKGSGKLSGWLAYTYSRSFMQVDSQSPDESINGGKPYPSNYDRPHSLNLVSNIKMNRRLSFSSNVVYMTGRPISYPISLYYMEGMQFLKYSDRNSYRIPDYIRWDLSVNLEGNLKKRKLFHSSWMLNVYNVTGRKNAYSVYYKPFEGVISGYKLSIFGQTIATLTWNFKLGNYATE